MVTFRLKRKVRGILRVSVAAARVDKSEFDDAAVNAGQLAICFVIAIEPSYTAQQRAIDSRRALRGGIVLIEKDRIA